MEGTYNEASRESGISQTSPVFSNQHTSLLTNPIGGGSDRRRKATISTRFSSPNLFIDHRRQFRTKFFAISDTLQQEIKNAVTHQLAFITADLDTLRNENVVLESERNPEFRTRLATEVTRARQDMDILTGTLNDLLNTAGDEVVMEG